MPTPPSDLNQFLSDNIIPVIRKLPEHQVSRITELRYSLFISSEGKVTDVRVLDPDLSENSREILREAFLQMAIWVPGKQGDKDVSTWIPMQIDCILWE